MAVLNNIVFASASASTVSSAAFTTSGNNRVIFLFIGYAGAANQASTRWQAPTRGGQTFTILDDGGSFPVGGGGDASDHYTEVWVLAAPNTASGAITINSIGGASLSGIQAWAVVCDDTAQAGWQVTRSTLDRDTTGAASTISGSATLSGDGTAIAFAWGSNQGQPIWGTPSWTAGTELLATQTPASFARAGGATLTGTGSKSFTWNSSLSGGVSDLCGVARLLVVDAEPAGTIASVGDFGTGSSSTSSTTLTMTTATAMSAGQTAILGIYSDNTSTTDGSNGELTSVSGGTGVWDELGEYTNGNGAAAAGATVALYRFVASGTVASGTTITITFSSARGDQCCSGWIFSSAQPLILDPDAGTNPIANVTDASSGFGSAAFSGLGNRQHLFVRVGAKEANSTTQITPSAGFAAFTAVRSRDNASAMLGRGEWDIDTVTGSTSNPTLAVSGDTAALFVALVEAQTQALTPGRHDNSTAFYAATVALGAANLSPARYDSESTFFGPTVIPGPVGLVPARYDNASAFYAAAVTRGAVTLSPGLLTNSQTFYAHTLAAGAVTLSPLLLSSPSLLFAPTVSQGTVNLGAPLLANSPAFYAHTATGGAINLTPPLLSSPSLLFAPTVTAGPVTLDPPPLANSPAFFAPTVTRGAVALQPGLLANTNTFYAHALAVGPVALSAPLLTSTQQLFAPSVVSLATLQPGLLTSSSTLYPPTAAAGTTTLAPPLLANDTNLFAHTVQLAGQQTPAGNPAILPRRRRR